MHWFGVYLYLDLRLFGGRQRRDGYRRVVVWVLGLKIIKRVVNKTRDSRTMYNNNLRNYMLKILLINVKKIEFLFSSEPFSIKERVQVPRPLAVRTLV